MKWLVVVALLASTAYADEQQASDAFKAAEAKAVADDPSATDAFEAIGRAVPVTRWSDDAWTEAARAAERAGDLARASRDLEQALAITTDDTLARRARGDLARLVKRTGDGAFAAVAASHDRLVARIQDRGDPKPALRELGALVAANPKYPRAATAMLALAHGWERDGAFDTAHAWLVRAQAAAGEDEHERVAAELARFATRAGEFAEAEAAIATLHDHELAVELTTRLDSARTRHALRSVLWIVLALVAAAAAFTLRRSSASWRSALRRLARPPTEVVFLIPIAIVIALVAATGNPLVARAVRAILIVGLVVAWISGALLASPRPSRGRLIAHMIAVAMAVIAASYLAIDRDRMIDLVVETWRSGPQPR